MIFLKVGSLNEVAKMDEIKNIYELTPAEVRSIHGPIQGIL